MPVHSIVASDLPTTTIYNSHPSPAITILNTAFHNRCYNRPQPVDASPTYRLSLFLIILCHWLSSLSTGGNISLHLRSNIFPSALFSFIFLLLSSLFNGPLHHRGSDSDLYRMFSRDLWDLRFCLAACWFFLLDDHFLYPLKPRFLYLLSRGSRYVVSTEKGLVHWKGK